MIPPRFAHRLAGLKATWQGMNGRDRKALSLLAVVAAIALAGQALWSLEQARTQAARQLPPLAASLEKMRVLVKDWQQLSEAARPAIDANAARRNVDRRLGELGKGLTGQWNGEGELLIKGQAEFSGWLRWTAAMQQESALRPVSCQLRRNGESIDIEARYRLAGLAQ